MYTVVFEWAAWRGLEAVPSEGQARILAAIDRLAREPYPGGSRLLRGPERRYRLRVGSYRVIYAVRDEQGQILVLAIGHRKEIYR